MWGEAGSASIFIGPIFLSVLSSKQRLFPLGTCSTWTSRSASCSKLCMAEGTAGTEWSVREIDLILADYFDMLSLELADRPYTKADRNTALQKLIGRSRGSIEYKHQNISAALMHLGLPWIRGYKPMANFQRALLDGIARHYSDVERGWMPKCRRPSGRASPRTGRSSLSRHRR